jgi:tetratricopeptide (TPR) repeat protein
LNREFQRLLSRGNDALTSGRDYEAIEAFSGAIALDPNSLIALLKRSTTYRQREEYESARRDLERAVFLEPNAPRPLELLGDLQVTLQDFASAATYYQRFIELEDQDARVLYKLAYAYHRNGQVNKVIDELNHALRIDDTLVEGHHLLGLALTAAGREAEALIAFEHVIALNPDHVFAIEALSQLLKNSDRSDDYLAQLKRLAELEPDRPERLIALGQAYVKHGRWDNGINILNYAVERYPQSVDVHTALGRVWLITADRESDTLALNRALELLETAATNPLSTSDSLALWGHALLLVGDIEAAAKALREATLRFPISPTTFRDLAVVEQQRGNPHLALEARKMQAALDGGLRPED